MTVRLDSDALAQFEVRALANGTIVVWHPSCRRHSGAVSNVAEILHWMASHNCRTVALGPDPV